MNGLRPAAQASDYCRCAVHAAARAVGTTHRDRCVETRQRDKISKVESARSGQQDRVSKRGLQSAAAGNGRGTGTAFARRIPVRVVTHRRRNLSTKEQV
jgi:hypothetical protein